MSRYRLGLRSAPCVTDWWEGGVSGASQPRGARRPRHVQASATCGSRVLRAGTRGARAHAARSVAVMCYRSRLPLPEAASPKQLATRLALAPAWNVGPGADARTAGDVGHRRGAKVGLAGLLHRRQHLDRAADVNCECGVCMISVLVSAGCMGCCRGSHGAREACPSAALQMLFRCAGAPARTWCACADAQPWSLQLRLEHLRQGAAAGCCAAQGGEQQERQQRRVGTRRGAAHGDVLAGACGGRLLVCASL